MRVLVTGATGLIGSHLTEYLVRQPDVEVYGMRRWRSPSGLVEGATYVDGDILDYQSVSAIVATVHPNVVFHLAAQSYTSPSFSAPRATWDVNAIGTVNLLEALRLSSPKPDMCVVASSAAAYGEQEVFPTPEEAPFRPVSPYGVTKAAQDLLGFQYYRAYGVPIVRTRSYIHVGTRQGLQNAVQAFTHQIALAEAGGIPPALRVGNLETRRDFTDIRDVVRAFWLLAQKGKPGEAYNVCTGEARRIGDVLTTLLGLSRIPLNVEVDPSRLRTTDPAIEVGLNERLRDTTGWRPEIPFADTLAWILNWRRDMTEDHATRQ